MPATLSDLDFRLDHASPFVAFVDTLGHRGAFALERIAVPQRFARWCVEAGLSRTQPKVSDQQLEVAWQLREAIYRFARALANNDSPVTRDLALINEWAARPSLAPQFNSKSMALTWMGTGKLEEILAHIARDAIITFTSISAERIRFCANEKCNALFVDHSRPGKRRWCSMTRCGNRSKQVTYQRKRSFTHVPGGNRTHI
jgi:predicted RNA-binding Zn ribbon-like protein